jgi:hypothetical protein
MFALVQSLFQVRTIPKNSIDNVNKNAERGVTMKESNVPDIMALVEFPEFLTKNFTWAALKSLCSSNPVRASKDSSNRIIIGLILFLGTLVYPIALTLLYGIIGFVLTYQVYYKYGALKAGGQAWGILTYYVYHIHHWTYCSIILLCLWLGGLLHPFFIGLCFGGIIHGIQYPDWLHFSGKAL